MKMLWIVFLSFGMQGGFVEEVFIRVSDECPNAGFVLRVAVIPVLCH